MDVWWGLPARMMRMATEPLGFCWVLLVVLTIWLWRRRDRGPALASAVIVLLLSLFGGTPLPWWLLSRLEAPYVGQSVADLPRVDAILMLGGGESASRVEPIGYNPAEASDRFLTAVHLLDLGKSDHLVLGGGSSTFDGEDVLDSEAVLKWWRPRLPLRIRIDVLPFSRNTFDEARSMIRLAEERGWKRIALVTSAAHLGRAVALFRGSSLQVVPVGCDFDGTFHLRSGHAWRNAWCLVPREEGFHAGGDWSHEWVGILVYRLRGWL